MILSYETIISRIVETGKISKQELEDKINQKLRDLQGIITKEGAAHIIANSLDIKFFDAEPKTFKIGKLHEGLNSVTLVGKVISLYGIRTFQKKNQERRVANLLIGDETGTTRAVIWDEKIIEEIPKIKEGDIIKVLNSQTRNNNNNIEIHLGNKAELIINPENESIGEIKLTPQSKRKEIKDLNEKESAEVYGTIVQIFESRYYNSCPVCNKKVLEQDGKFSCMEHGIVPPNKVPIVNAVIDDGTDNIRAVFFRDLAEKLTGKDETFENIKKEVLGKQIIAKVVVNNNEMFQRKELRVNSFEYADPEEILKELESSS